MPNFCKKFHRLSVDSSKFVDLVILAVKDRACPGFTIFFVFQAKGRFEAKFSVFSCL